MKYKCTNLLVVGMLLLNAGSAQQKDDTERHTQKTATNHQLQYEDSEFERGIQFYQRAQKKPQDPKIAAYHEARRLGDTQKMRELESQFRRPSPNYGESQGQLIRRESITIGRPGEPVFEEPQGHSPDWGNDIHVRGGTNTTFRESHPAMATASDGTIYICWENVGQSGINDYIQVYYSTDGGTVWNAYGYIVNSNYNLREPSLAIGEGNADMLLIAYIVDDGVVPHPEVAASPLISGGFNWTIHAVPYSNYFGNSYAKPNIWTDSYDWSYWYAYLTCEGIIDGVFVNDEVIFWRSLDYGMTWQDKQTLFGGMDGDDWRDPDGTYGTIGNNLFIACFNETDSYLYVIRSLDFGSTWQDTIQVAQVNPLPTHAVDPDIEAATDHDNIMLTCTKSFNGADNIGQTYSSDGGYTWGPLLSLEGYTSVNEFAVELTANEGGHNWHLCYTSQDWWVYYSTRPQNLSQLWQAVPDKVNDIDRASDSYPKKAITSNWASDEPGIAWADYRDGSPDYDIYFDHLPPKPYGLFASDGYDSSVPLLWQAPIGYNPLKTELSPPGYLSNEKNASGIAKRNPTGEINSLKTTGIESVLLSYNIYRSTNSGGPYTLLANVNRQYYRDMSVNNGTTYYYTVQAVYDDGVSSLSNESHGSPELGGYIINSGFASVPPVIDGTIGYPEWAAASVTDITGIGASNPVTLYTMNDGNYLYLAMDDLNDTNLDDHDGFVLYFDEDHNFEWPLSSPSSEGYFTFDYFDVPSVFICEYGGISGWWPSNLIFDTGVIAAGVNQSISSSSGHVQYEVQIDLSASELNALPGDQIGLFMYSPKPGGGFANGIWPSMINLFGYADEGPFSYGTLVLADVINPPDIDVVPSSLSFTVSVGSTANDILTISNTALPGSSNLLWNITEQDVTVVLDNGQKLPGSINKNSGNRHQSSSQTSSDISRTGINIGKPRPEKQPQNLISTRLLSAEKPIVSLLRNEEQWGKISSPSNLLWDINLILDDGTIEAFVGAGVMGGQFIWLNRFTPNPSDFPFLLDEIHILYGSGTGVNIGELVDIYVYEDTDGDGDPGTGANFLGAFHNAAVQFVDNINFSVYPISSITLNGPGDVIIAVVNRTAGTDPGELPAAIDWTSTHGRSWYGTYVAGNPPDPPLLPADLLWGTIDSFGLPGNWMIRGYGTHGSGCLWLSENPIIGTIPAGSSQNVNIMVDATGLTPGTYNCNLLIGSNDPDENPVTIPVTLNVTAPNPPDIDVSPTSFSFNVPENGTASDMLTISNTALPGAQNLLWDITENEITLALKNGRELPLSIQPINSKAQSYTSTLQVRNADRAEVSINKPQAKPSSQKVTFNRDLQGTASSDKMFAPVEVFIPSSRTTANTLLIETNSLTNSVERVLNELGVVYDLISTWDFTTIDFTPYTTIIIGMDGGSISEASVQAVANEAASGKDLIMLGGANLTSYYTGVQNYLLQHNGTTGWAISSSPHLTVTNPGHPLALGLPSPYDYLDPSAANYMLRITDPAASVAAINGDGFPALVSKPIGSGNLIYSVSTPYDGYYTNDPDYQVLKTIIRNALGLTDCLWLSESPTSGTIPPAGSNMVTIDVNAIGLTAGTYNCDLIINSNDPDENPVIVPVTLNVLPSSTAEFAVVTNVDEQNIHIIDVANNAILGPFLGGSLGTNQLLDPVITPDGQTALITNFEDQMVFFVDVSNPLTPGVVGGLNIGLSGEDICLTPDGAYALVTDGGYQPSLLSVIDVAAMSVIQTKDIAPREAQAVEIGPGGNVILADYGANQLHVLTVNLTTGALTDPGMSHTVGDGPLNVAISPDGQTGLVANINSSTISILHITGPGAISVTGTIPNILAPQSIAFRPDNSQAYVVETGTNPDNLAVLSVNAPGNVTDTGLRVNLLSDVSGGFYGVDVLDISSDGSLAYVGNPVSAAGTVTYVAAIDLNSLVLVDVLPAGNIPAGIAIGGLPCTPGFLGDVNGDGVTNSTDALIILSYDAGLPIPQPILDRINLGFGDGNDDGLTNSTDALLIISFDVGLPVPFPIGDPVCL